MKKTLFLFLIIILLGVIWAFSWQFVAGKVETALVEGKAKLEGQDKLFQCPNQEIGGFPFRISVTCDETSYFDNRKGFYLEAGALRSAAQAYQPGKAIVELEGPAVMTFAHNQTFDVKWKSLRASLSAGISGIEKISTIGKNISLSPTDPNESTLNIQEIQIQARRIERNSIDFATSTRMVGSSKEDWPKFDAAVNVRLNDIYDRISHTPDLVQIAKSIGLEGQLNGLDYISHDGGKISFSGPMQIDKQGYLSGKFNMTVSELQPLVRSLAKAFPDYQVEFLQAESAISLLNSGNNSMELKLPVTVSKGRVNMGIVPIGNIPRLF
ncbi:MAG: DUF2125 domain-containing protein [Rhizobiaceae bacterium]